MLPSPRETFAIRLAIATRPRPASTTGAEDPRGPTRPVVDRVPVGGTGRSIASTLAEDPRRRRRFLDVCRRGPPPTALLDADGVSRAHQHHRKLLRRANITVPNPARSQRYDPCLAVNCVVAQGSVDRRSLDVRADFLDALRRNRVGGQLVDGKFRLDAPRWYDSPVRIFASSAAGLRR